MAAIAQQLKMASRENRQNQERAKAWQAAKICRKLASQWRWRKKKTSSSSKIEEMKGQQKASRENRKRSQNRMAYQSENGKHREIS